jgi:hypothetical protein
MQIDLPFVNALHAPALGLIEIGVAPDGSVTVTTTPCTRVSPGLRTVKRTLPIWPAVIVFGVELAVMVRPGGWIANIAVTVVLDVNVT